MAKRVDTVVTQLRQYDEAVKRWLTEGLPTRPDDKPVSVSFMPERAFSARQEDRKTEGEKSKRTIVLPAASIVRTRITADQNRYHGKSVYQKLATSADKKTIYQVQYPLPFDIFYKLELWSKTKEACNAFQLWLLTQFTGCYETFISVDLSGVYPAWTNRRIPVESDGQTEMSDTLPDEDQRIVKFIQELKVKAWITGDIEEIKSVLSVNTTIYATNISTDIQTVTSDEIEDNPSIYTRVSGYSVDSEGNESVT